jgi:hypothetical protein
MTTETLVTQPRFRLAIAEPMLHCVVAVLIVVVSVSSFAISTLFGVGVALTITVLTATILPAGMPLLVAVAFLFQNTVVAWYTPLIPDNDTFDSLRGANFVILMAAFAAFVTASFQARVRAIAPLRPWLVGSMILVGVIALYFGLGVVRGVPKDAIVYFRNAITPVACFFVGTVSASLYRIDMRRTVLWLGVAVVFYGYCELFFTMDFLSVFHGDLYIERDIWRQIQTGVWEKALAETGIVLRGLQDVMTTNFFNLPGLGDLFPKVFRIGGPNFHNISFAYALSVISAWLLFNRRWGLSLLALPLLVVIGSKGAMALLIFAAFVRIASPLFGVRPTLILTLVGAFFWLTGSILFGIRSGDYHVLGLLAGLRDFLDDPLGQGLGIGGNLSSTSININWELAQAEGAAGIPMESAVGVMLYQMGIGSVVFFGFLIALMRTAWRTFAQGAGFPSLFLFVSVLIVSANAVLQEEAFFSPLALGLCLLLGGVTLGAAWNPSSRVDSDKNQLRQSRVFS